MGPNPFLVPGGRLRDIPRLRRTHHHFRQAFLTDVLEPVGRAHAQLALFASDLFVIAGAHTPDPVVAESPRGNMLP